MPAPLDLILSHTADDADSATMPQPVKGHASIYVMARRGKPIFELPLAIGVI